MVPQILMIVLLALSLGAAIVTHGKVEVVKKSFWVQLITVVINVLLLLWGGYFDVFLK